MRLIVGGFVQHKNIVKSLVMATALVALSACATVTRGTKESFYVLSDPDGAEVALSIGPKCVAPCAIKLKRNKEFDASYSLAGYKPTTVHVATGVRGGGVGATAGNIIAGGLIGVVVDGTNGSMNDLSPNPLKVKLAPEGSSEESMVVAGVKPKGLKVITPPKVKKAKK